METSGQDTYHSGSLVELLGQATETHRPPCEQQSVFKISGTSQQPLLERLLAMRELRFQHAEMLQVVGCMACRVGRRMTCSHDSNACERFFSYFPRIS